MRFDRYIVTNVKEKHNEENPFHLTCLGKKAIPVEFEVGKPAVFVYYFGEDDVTPWHRMVTSNVVSVEEVCTSVAEGEYEIVVETENTFYTFTQVNEELKIKEAYNNMVCALTHNIDVCANCKKCDEDPVKNRLTIIKTFAKHFGFELPWEDNSNEI